jgi:DNA repair protein RecO (recombination protein O)
MYLQDLGIVISQKKLQENNSIIKILSKNHGILMGVLKDKKKSSTPSHLGQLVNFSWKARLEEQLGMLQIETVKNYSALMMLDKAKLYIFHAIVQLLYDVFKEGQNAGPLFDQIIALFEDIIILDNHQYKEFALLYTNFELEVLKNAGYGISLDECVVTGSTHDLSFVSPKSGRAVSYQAGYEYAEKLLKLPKFLLDNVGCPDRSQLLEATSLTEYFFKRYLLNNRPFPNSTNIFIDYLYSCYNQA